MEQITPRRRNLAGTAVLISLVTGCAAREHVSEDQTAIDAAQATEILTEATGPDGWNPNQVTLTDRGGLVFEIPECTLYFSVFRDRGRRDGSEKQDYILRLDLPDYGSSKAVVFEDYPAVEANLGSNPCKGLRAQGMIPKS